MFKIGEEVACVNPGRDIGLVKDKIYTIYWIGKDSQDSGMVEVLEAESPEPFRGYLAERFRKLKPNEKMSEVERKEVKA